jgi:Ca2+-binding EF-hand superfamily protein
MLRKAFQKRAADCACGRLAAQKAALHAGTSFASPESDSIQQQGHITMKASKLFVAGAAVALLPLSAAIAQSPAEPPAPESQGATFESLDKDSDGRISKTEADANANVKAQFSKYDVNGDGFIERAEVATANQRPAETPQQ